MLLDVPFYFNSGHDCGQVSLLSCIKNKFPILDISVEKLNELTFHQGKKITLPIQLVAGLSALEIPFKYYARDINFENLEENLFSLIEDFYAPFGKNIIQVIDSNALSASLEKIKNFKNFSYSSIAPSTSELESILDGGSAISSLINIDLFFGRENKFAGHYISLTGYDSENLYFHNSGPKLHGKNIPIKKEFYNKIRDLCFMDYGLIVV